MIKNVKILITCIAILLLIPNSNDTNRIITSTYSLENSETNLETTYLRSLRKHSNGSLGESTIMNKINLAIQHPGIIIEDSDDFIFGTRDNLVLDSDLYLTTNLTCFWDKQNKPPLAPSARMGHAMVYDPNTAKIILFGGNNGTNLSDTWVYDLITNTWIEKTPLTSPGGRYLHSLAYDSKTKKVVLFGGYISPTQFGDTWVYDPVLNTWTEQNPANSPSARYGHAIVYDNASDKFILYGGRAGSTNYADTWVYDLVSNDWTQMSPGSSPGTRFEHSMIFNPSSSKTILFGGHAGGGAYLDDTWVYDLVTDTWTEKLPDVRPNSRRSFDMVYITPLNKAFLYGGYNSGGRHQDTWMYDPETNTWTELIATYSPGAIAYHDMAYDSKSEKLVLFGGADGSGLYNDTWVYTFSGYSESGNFQSKLTSLANIYHVMGEIRWYPTNQPINTSLTVQIGLSNTTNDMDFQYTENFSSSFSFEGLGQYLRYRVNFKSNMNRNSTPRLNTVYINYELTEPKPTVQIIDPQNNSVVNGEISISALATSPNGIDKVCFYVQGLLLAWDDSTPYRCSWNSTNVDNGIATIIVIAESKLGQDNADSINIIISNPVDPKIFPPNPPFGLSAAVEDNFVVLNWSPPENNGGSPIKRYIVYRGTSSGAYIHVGIVTGGITSYNDTILIGGVTFYYVVTAVNQIGESDFSNTVSVTPAGTTIPQSGTAPNIIFYLVFLGLLVGILRRYRKI